MYESFCDYNSVPCLQIFLAQQVLSIVLFTNSTYKIKFLVIRHLILFYINT